MSTFNVDKILTGEIDDHSDMVLTERIRYLLDNPTSENHQLATRILNEFPFWYGTNKKMVYWTENHFIMHTSNQYLLYLYTNQLIPTHVKQQLDAFLDSRLELGISEFFSPVYLPMTIGALLNIYDYSPEDTTKDKIKTILDRIAFDTMTGILKTNDPNVSSLFVASARSYARHRLQSTDNTINLWVQFLISKKKYGFNPDKGILSVVLPKTSYIPPSFKKYKDGRFQIHLTKSGSQVQDWILRQNYNNDIKGTLLLTYGIYIPSLFRGLKFQINFFKSVSLFDYPDFKSFRFIKNIPQFILLPILKMLSETFLYSKTKMTWLTDAKMVIYRKGRIVLSFLERYHEGMEGAQQLVWALNLDTVPIYVQTKTNDKPVDRDEPIQNACLPRITFTEEEFKASYRGIVGKCGVKPTILFPKDKLEITDLGNGWKEYKRNNSAVYIRLSNSIFRLRFSKPVLT